MIVASTLQQMRELFFSRMFAHGHGSSCVGGCMENKCVPVLRGPVHVPRPSGGQRHAGKHRKSGSSAQVNSTGQGTLKTFYTKGRESISFLMFSPKWIKCFEITWSCDNPGPEKEIGDSIKIIPCLTQCTWVLRLCHWFDIEDQWPPNLVSTVLWETGVPQRARAPAGDQPFHKAEPFKGKKPNF